MGGFLLVVEVHGGSSFEVFLFEVHIILLVVILEDVKHESAIESWTKN